MRRGSIYYFIVALLWGTSILLTGCNQKEAGSVVSASDKEGDKQDNNDFDYEVSDVGLVELSSKHFVDGCEKTMEAVSWKEMDPDTNVILIKNAGKLTLTGNEIQKFGNTRNLNESRYYGLNAAISIMKKGVLSAQQLTIQSDAIGACGVYCGGSSSAVFLKGAQISTKATYSSGIISNYGANVEIEGANIQTKEENSVLLYGGSTIIAKKLMGTANKARMGVIKGNGNLDLANCQLNGAGDSGILLFSTREKKEETGGLNLIDSELTYKGTGAMFYATNTNGEIFLNNTVLNFDSGELLSVSQNQIDGWGEKGKNGANVKLTSTNQTLVGNITCDLVSSCECMFFSDTNFKGTIDGENKGDASVCLNEDAKWELTGDSHVSVFEDKDMALTNISSNGFNIYYDATLDENQKWNGKSVVLDGGGSLLPSKK